MRVAAWSLVGVAVVCFCVGVSYAADLPGTSPVEPSALAYFVKDAMFATVFLVLSGCAVLGLVVLFGVAQAVRRTDAPAERSTSSDRSEDQAR